MSILGIIGAIVLAILVAYILIKITPVIFTLIYILGTLACIKARQVYQNANRYFSNPF